MSCIVRKMKLIHRGDLLVAFSAIVFLIAFVPIFTYAYFAKDLTSKESVMNRNNTGVVLLDRNGQVFFKFYEGELRTFTPISQIPKIEQQAVISAEDKDFYSHPGFSLKSIIGAFIADLRHRDFAYGGSTITQQLVKNSLLDSNKSILRKYQELVLAQEIERRYTKDEILEMYLNSVYFGQGSFGIESAAKTYFNKSSKDLDLAQASLLAGILTAPSSLNPITGDINKATARQHYVLDNMVEKKFITPQQRDEAEKEKLTFAQNTEDTQYKAPNFALMVKDQLIAQYGEEAVTRGGWQVYTGLDLGWQSFAEKTVAEQVAKLKPDRVSNGAAVVIDPATGEVRALVGSKDWNDPTFGKFNIATALRQPGSSFKPIVYAAALEKRLITPATVLHDDPITYTSKGSPPYKPLDYDRKFRGPVLARRALVNSLNIPAIEVLMKEGAGPVIDLAQRLGISTLDPNGYYGPSFALGVSEVKLVELTNAYATFANQGQRNDITLVTKIVDKHGQTIYDYKPHPQQVISPEVSFLIASIISDNATRAEEFGTTLNISRQAAVKTGTTEDYKDALTVGFTPQIAIGVWVGNNDNTPMDQVAGSLGAAPIWKALMEEFLKGTPEVKFTPPPGVDSRSVCRSNGLLAPEGTSSGYLEYFLAGTEPTQKCYSSTPSPSPSTTVAPNASVTPPPSTPIPTPNPPTPVGGPKNDNKKS